MLSNVQNYLCSKLQRANERYWQVENQKQIIIKNRARIFSFLFSDKTNWYKPLSETTLAKPLQRHLEKVIRCRNTSPGLFRRLFGYIPVLSDWVLVAAPTFKIWSNSGVVTRNFAHEFVQELRGRHRGSGLPRRSFFWCCQAGRHKDNLVREGGKLGGGLIVMRKWTFGRWEDECVTVVIIHQKSWCMLFSFTSSGN